MNQQTQDTNNAAINTLYFLVGGLVGAGVALLFAPKSGAETRDLIAQKTQEGKEYLLQKGSELKDQAREYADRGLRAIDQGLKTLDEQKDRIAHAVEAGRESYMRD